MLENIDESAWDTMSLPMLYTRYLMSSFLYYKSFPVIPYTDIQFDMVCKRLLEGWDSFEHRHKHLTTKEDLRAGTGYAIEFPLIVQHAATSWVESFNTK